MSQPGADWESLQEELRGLSRRGRPLSCGMQKTLDSLPPADRVTLQEALDNAAYTTTALRQALARRGFAMSYSIVQRHRTGTCSCGEE